MLIDLHGQELHDTWTEVGVECEWPNENVLLDVSTVQQNAEALNAYNGKLGVILQSDDDPKVIEHLVDRLSLIALNFPKFSDGRPYSTARLLRTRYGFAGDLRAIGDVLTDQLGFMMRCGFTSLKLSRTRDFESVRQALNAFSHAYQTSADHASVQSIWQKRRVAAQPEKI